jgi:hypothetical protein
MPEGRQSPDPATQSGKQKDPLASDVKQGGGESGKPGNDQSAGLTSNPEHPLAKHSEETTSKKK